MVEDMVSRKWLATIVSAEETSTQVQLVFTDALEAEGLLEVPDDDQRRAADGDERSLGAAAAGQPAVAGAEEGLGSPHP